MTIFEIGVKTTFEIEAPTKDKAIEKLWEEHGIYEHEIEFIRHDNEE